MVNMRAGVPRLGTVCDEYRLADLYRIDRMRAVAWHVLCHVRGAALMMLSVMLCYQRAADPAGAQSDSCEPCESRESK